MLITVIYARDFLARCELKGFAKSQISQYRFNAREIYWSRDLEKVLE